MQLERLLQKHGFGTRKACRALIRHERVAVNGTLCDDPFADIDTAGLVFTVDGVDWPYAEFASLVLHKPAGYECSRKPQHHPSVLELLPLPLRERGVQPIGRLDEDTTLNPLRTPGIAKARGPAGGAGGGAETGRLAAGAVAHEARPRRWCAGEDGGHVGAVVFGLGQEGNAAFAVADRLTMLMRAWRSVQAPVGSSRRASATQPVVS